MHGAGRVTARSGSGRAAAGVAVVAALAAGCSTGHPPTRHASATVNSTSSSTGAAPSSPAPSTPARSTPARSTTHLPTPPASQPTAIPPVSAQARAAGLVDVRTVVPDALIDLRYATADNFAHVRLYPADARCLVHRSMLAGLRSAAAALRRAGYRLVFWDCYRPHPVQVRMFRIVPDPNWVARPGPYATSHEAGRSVDVTLATRSVAGDCRYGEIAGHCLLDMGTGFDDFTARAHAYAISGVSRRAQDDRALLRRAMAASGLVVYAGEWWHFDGPGALVRRPILDAPVD
jgi:D-alanyl-D-alanine dipeptidase